MKEGDVLVHEGHGHLVLILGVDKDHVTKLGGPIYRAIVLEAGASPYPPGHMMGLIPEQPYKDWFASRENSVE